MSNVVIIACNIILHGTKEAKGRLCAGKKKKKKERRGVVHAHESSVTAEMDRASRTKFAESVRGETRWQNLARARIESSKLARMLGA
jgi:hypothetical protein